MGVCCGSFGWGGWSGMGLIGPILGLVLFAAVLGILGLGTVWVIRQAGRSQTAQGSLDPVGEPLEIAKRRLATGDITTEEFEEIRDRLQG